jgi:hypothetical protein
MLCITTFFKGQKIITLIENGFYFIMQEKATLESPTILGG